MTLNDLTVQALDGAAPALGEGPVTMVNLIWFRPKVVYPASFAAAQPDPRSALYGGYAVTFSAVAQELGIEGVVAVYIGHRGAGLVASTDDDWDDVVIVRYRSFSDFRKIVESRLYAERVRPHHRAAVATWRLIATTD